MVHSKIIRVYNPVLRRNPDSSGSGCGAILGDVADTTARLVKELEANGECALDGGPWFEQYEKK